MLQAGIRFLIVILIVVGAAGSRAADESQVSLTRNPSELSDADLDARLRFLEQRLDDGETWAKCWQWGWTSFFAGSMLWGTGRAIAADQAKNRVDHIVTAVESAIGTAQQVILRHPGRNGAESLRAIKGDSREARLARLAEGESLLQAIAKRAEERKDWKLHAGNVALNLAGAAFIFGFGHESDAWESLGIGIAVGEISIWSAPKRGIQDLNDYETRFGMKTAKRFNWSIVPTMGGAALRVSF
jgi:hypothetical protein